MNKIIKLEIEKVDNTETFTLQQFNGEEILKKYKVDTRWELFDKLEKINGKFVVSYSLGDEEVEQTLIIVWNDKHEYLQWIRWNEIETLTLEGADNE